jgi:hypothetical protein
MQNIINAFEKFMAENGTRYHEFYIGIATDPVDRLTNGHGINQEAHIYWDAPLHTNIVRTIEKYFLEKGARGGPGGGDSQTQYVYIYKISPNTRD